MSDTVCPYCRGPVFAEEGPVVCNGCGTAHHSDCYDENGGCTVFGCSCAPPEEPKVSVSAPDLVSATAAAIAAPRVISRPAPPPPPGVNQNSTTPGPNIEQIGNRVVPSMFGAFQESVPEPEERIPTDPKSRISYMVLGALLGAFGAHNFYAGYYKKAWLQLAITVFSVGFAAIMSWIWAVIDICTIDRDVHGIPFAS